MTRLPLGLYLVLAVASACLTSITYEKPYGDVVYLSAYLGICGMACWVAFHQRRSSDRRPWLYVAFAQVTWWLGDAVYPLTFRLGVEDSPAASAVLWTLGYIAYGAALIAMARRRAGRWLRPAVLDMLTLAVAAAIVVWIVFISPHLAEAAADPLSTYYLYMLGPLGDLVVLASVLLLVFSPGRRTGATWLLISSAVLRIASDLGYQLIPSFGLAMSVGFGVILMSNALLIAAALHPNRGELTETARRVPTLHAARIWFLGAGLLTAPTVLLARPEYAENERFLLFAAGAINAALILARFASALRSLERAERTLSFRSTHDPLTGLANRAALNEELEVCPPGSTVLYLDLDGFKAVNDSAGHSAGDAILQAVATRLRGAVRDCDTVARLGGDEFAVVLTGLDADDAVGIAERILRDVAQPIEHEGTWHTVGTSIGIAGSDGADTGSDWRPAALLRAADTAMYRAKRLGRGRWIRADAIA